MSLTADVSDNTWSLYFKMAENLYEYALAQGAMGLNAPNINDTVDLLLKKSAYYTASVSP